MADPDPRGTAETYRLDLNAYRLWYGGVSILVTALEGKTLECLMRWPGHVKTRQQLLDYAQPDNTESCDRSVDTHIKRIRRKCKQAFGAIGIRSMSGAGYVFEGVAEIASAPIEGVLEFTCQWQPLSEHHSGETTWACAVCGAETKITGQPFICEEIRKKQGA